MEVLELNIQADHIHLVVSFAQQAQSAIPPEYAVLSLIGYLKGKLAGDGWARLFERSERLGRKYWGRHLWARGYCVNRAPTGHGIDEEMIRTYVRWQEKRERTSEQRQGKLFD